MFGLMAVDLLTFLSNTYVIIGLVAAAVGIALVCLAKRIARSHRGNVEVSNNDKFYVGFVIFGLCVAIAGFVLIAVGAVVG